LEAALITFLSIMSGANLNHDVGYLDFGRTGSLEMVAIMDEIIDQLRRFQKGVLVNDEKLGLDVIREVGPGGQFLTHDHTLKHCRLTQWRPRLICREGFEEWENSGNQNLLVRASQHVRKILTNHRPLPVPPEKLELIQTLVDQFKIQ
jgi:trimethylamine--corrinoid protein Co-methyltransferase